MRGKIGLFEEGELATKNKEKVKHGLLVTMEKEEQHDILVRRKWMQEEDPFRNHQDGGKVHLAQFAHVFCERPTTLTKKKMKTKTAREGY